MFLHVKEVLNAEQLKKADKLIAGAPFVDEAAPVGKSAKKGVKTSQLLDRDKFEKIKELDALFVAGLNRNTAFRAACMPSRVLPPLVSRYEKGMAYGIRSDNPAMGNAPAVRTDISCTIFLSDPDSYEGGELIVKSEAGDTGFKLPKGDALIYPGGALHTVKDVEKGVRLAAATWVQSMVRSAAKRQLLFDLDMACAMVNKKNPDTDEARLLLKTYGNLVRRWADM